MMNVFLGSAELGEAFGASAAAWPGMGLTVLRGTPADPGAAGEITVRRGEEVLGFTEISPAHDGRRVYRVVITTRASRRAVTGWVPAA
ncbi:hypothetical protein SAMN05421507_102666 [Lentzea jiangxiensis]|uniref:Uncharacterized protein n=2 Tax=Lentzea jiangxiensis TaxID=641025 RepID=A0A1H0JWY4_9PSEU|nr:hypothetical protein SAMN05421507_102666 [Lentzea jiangxiensis]